MQKFYLSLAWKKKREEINKLYKGLCLYSYYVLQQIVYTDYVHHIVYLKDEDGWDKKLDTDNLITVCAGVHQMIHNLNGKDKIKMQELLRELKSRWEEEMGTN